MPPTEQHELEIRDALLRQRRERLERAKQLEKEQLEQFDREATRLDEVECVLRHRVIRVPNRIADTCAGDTGDSNWIWHN